MSLALVPGTQLIVDPRDAAESAGLRYVSDDEPGLRRRKTGKGFSYLGADGKSERDRATRERIRKLAIPPAYTDVWICSRANGHIQATGRDAKGAQTVSLSPKLPRVPGEQQTKLQSSS